MHKYSVKYDSNHVKITHKKSKKVIFNRKCPLPNVFTNYRLARIAEAIDTFEELLDDTLNIKD